MKKIGKKRSIMNKIKDRKLKGNSVLQWVDDYVLVDIETTGLSPKENDIIEIGAIKVRNNKIIEEYESLIKINYNINPFITKLTGITNDMLKDGKNIENVLTEFIKFTGNDVIMGHNVNFDINFIYDNCEKYLKSYLTNDFIDTMQIAKKILPNSQNYKLGTLAEKFDVSYKGAHRGLKDVEITYEVYNKLREYAKKTYKII